MKGKIRRLFCWHEYKRIENWIESPVYDRGDDKPSSYYIRAKYGCSKCGDIILYKLKDKPL